MPAPRPTVLVSGIAEGLGAGIAKVFAAAGHDVIGLSRSGRATAEIRSAIRAAGASYEPLACDITSPRQVAETLQPFVGRVDVLVHSAHMLLRKPAGETTLDEFAAVWRVACFGAMAVTQQVLPAMTARGAGTIIFSGATAGLRGGANFAAFASAKFALRGLSQALARECGPEGVHVAHVVLDGLIDEPQTEQRFGPARSTRIDPEAAAQAYLDLARQPRSAWTQELDLRPFDERF